MTTHARHPAPADREEFLVDGCPRCAEYAADLGLHFDADRFRAFWAKMIDVEFRDAGGWASDTDKALGRSLFKVALALQRAFGINPLALAGTSSNWRLLEEAAEFCERGGAVEQAGAVRAARHALEHVHAAAALGAEPPEIAAIARGALSEGTPS